MPPVIRTIFLDDERRLRNGWWMLVFVALFLLSRVLYTPISKGLQGIGADPAWLEPLRFGFTLLVTWICVRLRGETLASVGFDLGARWTKHLVFGAGIGFVAMIAIVGLIAASGGVRLELATERDWAPMLYGACVFLFVALLEENLCRGFLFQRLADGTRFGFAQIAFGAVFALAHWDNPGMSGLTKVIASADLFLGAILLGLAWRRTQSLALPVGIHLGWNWTQGYLLGFDVSGIGAPGWFHPVLTGDAVWRNGGAFGPEASVFAILVDLVVIAALWRWRGSARRADVPLSQMGAAAAATGAARA